MTKYGMCRFLEKKTKRKKMIFIQSARASNRWWSGWRNQVKVQDTVSLLHQRERWRKRLREKEEKQGEGKGGKIENEL